MQLVVSSEGHLPKLPPILLRFGVEVFRHLWSAGVDGPQPFRVFRVGLDLQIQIVYNYNQEATDRLKKTHLNVFSFDVDVATADEAYQLLGVGLDGHDFLLYDGAQLSADFLASEDFLSQSCKKN